MLPRSILWVVSQLLSPSPNAVSVTVESYAKAVYRGKSLNKPGALGAQDTATRALQGRTYPELYMSNRQTGADITALLLDGIPVRSSRISTPSFRVYAVG
jgi:hypothetical protein